jgi:hypothetical protein
MPQLDIYSFFSLFIFLFLFFFLFYFFIVNITFKISYLYFIILNLNLRFIFINYFSNLTEILNNILIQEKKKNDNFLNLSFIKILNNLNFIKND